MESKGQRLAKVIARAGICSRRQAEIYIADGRVKVNSQVITTPATNVLSTDIVEVDGNKLQSQEETRLWLFYKPRGCITSNFDPKGRSTVFDFIPKNLPRVMTVGRLDFNSEGLLLLTNDGEYARHLELPAQKIIREYRVRIHGRMTEKMIAQLKAGITVEGIKYAPIEVTVEKPNGTSNYWVVVRLQEGKNREIRKVFAHFGIQVSRLIRTAYGPYKLNWLTPKDVVEVKI